MIKETLVGSAPSRITRYFNYRVIVNWNSFRISKVNWFSGVELSLARYEFFFPFNVNNFGDYFQRVRISQDDEQSGRFSNRDQLIHFAAALSLKGWKVDKFFKEDNIRWIFDELGWQFHSVLDSRETHKTWVFLLFYQFCAEDGGSVLLYGIYSCTSKIHSRRKGRTGTVTPAEDQAS